MTKKKNNQLLGAHLSIAHGLSGALIEAENIGASACQIFVKNGRSWRSKPLAQNEIDAFIKTNQEVGPILTVAHASYLINIASTDEAVLTNSMNALADELTRCDQLHIPYLVLHPGSHKGAGAHAGCLKIAHSLNQLFSEKKYKTILLLETAAGQGTNVGSTFEELALIIKNIDKKERVGVCFDTCHVNSAGYQLFPEEEYQKTFAHLDAIIGFEQLKVFHLNNSKTEIGSKKDRHEKLLKGTMPPSFFQQLVNDERFFDIPKILETPIEIDYLKEYQDELKWLRTL